MIGNQNGCGALKLRGFEFVWGRRTLVMGIVNTTCDSFSGDGVLGDDACAHGELLAQAGADLLDVGGESTRPGSRPVDLQTELERVVPVVSKLRAKLNLPISVDTTKPTVLRAAVAAGADLLNSVHGCAGGLLEEAARLGVPMVIMHNQPPGDGDVVEQVADYLLTSAQSALAAGLPAEHIILDPGIGFKKTAAQNLELLSQLHRIKQLGFPVLVGTSRKSTIGLLTARQVTDRAFGTAASVTLSVAAGADIVRVHDVASMVDVIRVSDAIVRSSRLPASTVAIGIGSNLNEPQAQVTRAIERLASLGRVLKVSSLYKTKAWGFTDQADFINAAALISVKLSPYELLNCLQQIEQEMGRTETFRWGPRIIDLDILAYEELSIREPRLTLPHPEMHSRPFVLIPLCEIAPQYESLAQNFSATELAQVKLVEQSSAANLG